MDSTDERIFRRQQTIREAEAKEHAKRVQKELAKKRMSNPMAADKMISISSEQFQEEEKVSMNSRMD